jgi:4-aminobutyrate aminotransferase-like enzyme
VQTGFGRTGKLFATEHYDVLPDIVTLARSMAGGMTLSAVCGRAEVIDAPAPGGLGGTYAGNPLAIAAAHAVIDVMEQEKLVERSNLLGEKLMARLTATQANVPALKEVLILLTCGVYANVIRFLYPLTTEDAVFDKALEILDRALAKV